MNKDSKKIYKKLPLEIAEQIFLLKSRGLLISDENAVETYLKNISYYHLSIYFKFFQTGDDFIRGTTFEDVFNIYTFDNKLRFLLLEVLERIEKSFKCRVAYELSFVDKNSHCHTSEEIFLNRKSFNKIQNIFKNIFTNSKEISIDHYKRQYEEPPLAPVWMMIEIVSFGQSVLFLNNLRRHYRNLVSRTYGVDEIFLSNWMQCLSAIRNNCAHHTRLWNRTQILTVKIDHEEYKDYFILDSKKLYNYLVVMQIIMKEVNPGSLWLDKLELLISEHGIDVNHMGFPEEWKSKLLSIIEKKV